VLVRPSVKYKIGLVSERRTVPKRLRHLWSPKVGALPAPSGPFPRTLAEKADSGLAAALRG
jgi:hypothetical protein